MLKENSKIGQKPESKTGDPFIFTRDKACGPFSFLNSKEQTFKENAPPPIYLSLDDLNFQKEYSESTLFEGYDVQKNGELKNTDEEISERQKGVIMDLLKEAGTKLMNGKSLVGISLPVRIFEPRTMLDRCLDGFHTFPHYLQKAADSNDTIERLKYISSAILSNMSHCISAYKPFNPILGETFQGSFDNDTQIYVEHISHHPAISAFHLVNPKWQVSGKWIYNMQFGLNVFKVFNEGWFTIKFNDGEQFKYIVPMGSFRGALKGDRYYRTVGSAVVLQQEKKLKCVLKVGEDDKKGFGKFFGSTQTDKITGAIYEYDEDKNNKLMNIEDWVEMSEKMRKMNDQKKVVCKVSGSWIKNLKFDNDEYYNIQNTQDISKQQVFGDDPLPSDMRFREDLIWLNYGNENYSQEWKVMLEVQQRLDRKNRQKKDK